MSGDRDPIRVQREGAVTTIIIIRPHARNALDTASVLALERAFRSFDEDESARIAVLYGTGGTFCAGADLKELATGTLYEAWAGGESGMLGAPLSKPLIAAVEGHAVAGGLGLALYCDIRIADETAVFGVFCRRYGVPMSDGTTVRLPRLIGEARAMDMLLTGRAVTADEAKAFGLVSEVVARREALSRAQELAREIAAFPQTAMRSDRMSLLESRGRPLREALRREAELAEKKSVELGRRCAKPPNDFSPGQRRGGNGLLRFESYKNGTCQTHAWERPTREGQ
ncbi:MAG: crotonase/enoyl-CoA hydratase family protein [Candidatus Rokubacteria bacterium]|nr:crotonase/enoyl-CoA hydratase family protein [Candidatus Rokubacteria bacterium]